MVEQPGKYDTYGRPALRPVASSIEELTGTLEIDNLGTSLGGGVPAIRSIRF